MANWDSYRDDLDTLKSELENLIETRNDVMRRIQIAEEEEQQQPMKPTTEVQLWLSRVQAVETEVDELIKQASEEIDRLPPGGFSYRTFNMSSSYEFKDMVADKLQAVTNLINEGAVLLVDVVRVVTSLKDEGALEAAVPETMPEDEADDQWPIVGMESIINEVWRCLKKEGEEEDDEDGGGGGDDDGYDYEEEEEEEDDDDVGIIGVYGMGGVGKTTLLKQINKKLLQMKNDFDVVIWVVVSRDLQLDKIQQQIGEKIGLFDNKVWKHKHFEEKASDIFKNLEEKKFVLLMDDLWEWVDLTKVGVPLPSPENSSKIVFTTRSLQICSLMEADKLFKATCLSDNDAWKLFKTLVGDETLRSHPEVLDLAIDVSRECCGLPLALVSIGRAMVSKKTPQEWSHVIEVLTRSMTSISGSDDQLKKDIHYNLRLSYDNLQNDMFKSCFLYCLLFPRYWMIKKRDLIDYWIGEGFLDERLGEQSQGHYIIDVLLSVCLLEQSGEDDDSVKMHYWIHDMSLWIASKIEMEKGNCFFCNDLSSSLTETEAEVTEYLVKATKMSLLNYDFIENLSGAPKCPNLQTLFLIRNSPEVIRNDFFFQFMHSFKVLNLSDNMFLAKLPSGISKLISLQHLDLSGCTEIQELPKELRALKKLKCLNLERTAKLHIIPRQLISEFSMLHVLRLLECGFMLKSKEDRVVCNDAQLLIEELLCLKNLSMLSISLDNSHALQRLLSSNRLQSCIQSLGLRHLSHPKSIKVPLTDLKHLNKLEISNCEYLEELEVDFVGEAQDVRESTYSFYFLHEVLISKCRKLRELTWLILAPNLKHLRISNCAEMEEIINVGKLSEYPELMGNVIPFSKLKFLNLDSLPKLRSIYWTDLPFPDLKKPDITDCPMLPVPPRLHGVTSDLKKPDTTDSPMLPDPPLRKIGVPSANLQVGNALLVGLFQEVFDRCVPLNFSLIREHEVPAELRNWCPMLEMILLALDDAEEKQWTTAAVKMWLDHLRDFAYDLEDMLDELNTEFLRRSLKENSPENFISNPVEGLKNLLNNFKAKSKGGGMTERLKELCDRRSLLRLVENTSTAVRRTPPCSTSFPDKHDIHGRDEDIRKILEMMSSAANFRVISIVGMAGVGKTTLAKQVYNHNHLAHFDRKAWICVSDDFDVLRISKEILESMNHSTCNLRDLNEVQVQLRLAVAERRFLLVLDDVWSKVYNLWETLISPFVTGAQDSRIIVTTQCTDVALTLGGLCDCYNLKLLSDDHCWSVFQQHAFESRNIDALQNLESVREKVVQKCGGLPLAARTLGGLLRSKHRNVEWEDISNFRIWDFPEDSDILPVLKLSYYHLPPHLKRCFAYCAILPKNYEFEEKELILLWMAEGLILRSANNKPMEDMGSKYFRNLLSRSIFQQSSGDASKFVMHNLFNDLAQWVSGETIFRLEDKLEDVKRVRHSSYITSEFDGKNKFKDLNGVIDQLRTFLPILTHGHNLDCYISHEVIFKMLPKFKKLRVLSLRNYYIMELPESIEELRYLRYLNLADTEIASLPDSLKRLFNLQILILRNCYRLSKLPPEVGTLINLRHLDIYRDIEGTRRRRELPTRLITEMPSGMQELKYLETLSNFIVGKDSGSPLKDLKNLMFLRGELHISQLENVTDSYAMGEAILSDKKNLEVLILEWQIGFDNSSRKEDKEKDVLHMLRPHANLKKLAINNYGGSAFPAWIEDPSFSSMEVLTLEGCENCKSLPSLGVLSKLKELRISGMKKLTTIDSGFYGSCSEPFQSLEILCLEDLQEWSRWDPIGDNEHGKVFNGLRELSIVKCPRLSGRLPAHLLSLQKLVIQQCAKLLVSIPRVPKLCELEIGECREMVYTDGAGYSLSPNSINHSNVSEFGNWLGPSVGKIVEKLKIKFSIYGSIPTMPFLSSLRALEITDCCAINSLQEVMEQSTHLDRLVIEGCDTLMSVAEGQLPSSLKTLQIRSCTNLRCVFDDGEANKINGPLLKYLYVSQCPALQSLSSTGQLPEALQHLEIQHCSQLTTIGQLPETLKRLDIKRLGSFSSAGQLPASLEHLSIDECLITTLSSTGHLPASLQNLNIVNCSKLTSLSSTGHLPASLQKLKIVKCSELTSLSSTGHLPASLQHLNIESCSKLTSLSSGQLLPATLEDLNSSIGISSTADGLQNLSNLQQINIFNCPNLESFPQGALPKTSLTVFSIRSCLKLNALPSSMDTLNSLQEMHIEGLPSLSSFPRQGLPINLTSLSIKDLKIQDQVMQPLMQQLHKLTSLRNLYIGGCQNAVCFPQEEKEMMPASLTRLTLENFSNLKRLSLEGFTNLASLEYLSIMSCPKLKYFLEKALPSSLLELYISKCYSLTNRCGNGGRYWSKISNIPYVEIDGKYIHEPPPV